MYLKVIYILIQIGNDLHARKLLKRVVYIGRLWSNMPLKDDTSNNLEFGNEYTLNH